MINSFTLAFKSLCKWIAKYGSAIFAFVLPLHMLLTSYALSIWFLFTLFFLFFGGYSWSNFILTLRTSKIVLLSIVFYLLLSFGLLYSDNYLSGISKITISIPFLITPLLFLVNKKLINISITFRAFLYGLLFSVILSLLNRFFYDDLTLNVFYEDFSIFHHSSYFAMMINIAIALFLFQFESVSIPKWLKIFVVLLCAFLVFLISSKSGILVVIMLFVAKSIHVIKSSSRIVPKLMIVFSIILSSVLLFQNNRVQKMIVNLDYIVFSEVPLYPTESTAIRWKIWEKSVNLIADSFVLGYGTGDANDKLMEAYNKDAYLLRHIIKRKYNAHNTFFQLWIMIGISGPLLILILLFSILKKHQYSYFSIGMVLTFLINFSLESMLERHAGVMIFTFFISLIIVCKDSPFFLNKQSH